MGRILRGYRLKLTDGCMTAVYIKRVDSGGDTECYDPRRLLRDQELGVEAI